MRAKHVSDYKLKVYFSDGATRTIDFEPFLKSSQNPMIRAFLDRARFAEFAVRDGDLMWGEYDLCFPIADLYENKV
ncbi:MAG TPA: DUF2442 domain-containing protein [Tepidisphaeraceae bacterium]|jgi:hypothetical protein|nr:DUF2442 domain-containing protein [Tepidisphaeraceae bacterium]